MHPASRGDSRPRLGRDRQDNDDTNEEGAKAPHQLAPHCGSPPRCVKPGCDRRTKSTGQSAWSTYTQSQT